MEKVHLWVWESEKEEDEEAEEGLKVNVFSYLFVARNPSKTRVCGNVYYGLKSTYSTNLLPSHVSG